MLVEQPGEGHALALAAAQLAQRVHLLGPVHPVGDGAHPEVGGDTEQAAGDLVQ